MKRIKFILVTLNKPMKDLTKIENWTPELRYVNKSRLIIGLIVGFLFGLYTRLFF